MPLLACHDVKISFVWNFRIQGLEFTFHQQCLRAELTLFSQISHCCISCSPETLQFLTQHLILLIAFWLFVNVDCIVEGVCLSLLSSNSQKLL